MYNCFCFVFKGLHRDAPWRWYEYPIVLQSKEVLKVNIQGQNLRCYHLNDGCGHEYFLLYTVYSVYSASSVLSGNFFLRALYPKVTLSNVCPRFVLSAW